MLLLSFLKYILLVSTIITLIFGSIFLFLSYQDKSLFMKIWGFCWVLYFFMFLSDILHLGANDTTYTYILFKQLFSLITSFLFLIGTYDFFNLEISPTVILLTVVSFFSIVSSFAFYQIYEVFLIPNILFSTSLVAWAGCIFCIYTWTQNLPEKYFLCFLIVLWSISGSNFTLLFPNLELSVLNYFGSLLILNVTIVFLLIVYFKKIYYLVTQQETRFRTLVENATEHIFLYSYAKKSFEYISPSATAIFGDSIAELKKDTSRFLIHLTTADREKIEFLLQHPVTNSSMETFCLIKDYQEPIWCELHYIPLLNDEGETVSLEGILRDITPRKKIEKELKEAEHMKRVLLEDIAHEIRTPVTLIKGYSEAILNHVIDPSSIQSYLKNIYSKTELLNTLVDDFMQASFYSSQTMEFRFYETNAKEFMEDMLSQCHDHITTASMTAHCTSDLPEDISFIIDTSRIQQVFSNLISNALRYAGEKATVTIVIQTAEHFLAQQSGNTTKDVVFPGEILVKVADSGAGIRDADLPHIFQRKYRGTDTNSVSGSGLGLFISKQIITQHSGRIWAKNEPNGGAAFYFTLPYYTEDDDEDDI